MKKTWEQRENVRTEVWVWRGEMGGIYCENKEGIEEKCGWGRRMSWCRISAWNNSMLGSDSWAIAAQILHITREGRCTSTHGANGLLLKTCITPHCLPTTHGAATPTSRVTASQLCSNSKCTVHHVTTNDTKQCHNYSGLFGQKTCLWVDCDSFVPL